MGNGAAQATPEAAATRPGVRALSLFARVLSADVLRAHADRAWSFAELEQLLGWAPTASLRVATANLCDLGALAHEDGRRGATELTAAGSDLLAVADALEGWLAHSPFGPQELSEVAARGTVKALVAGWEAGIVQALAGRPRSIAELRPRSTEHSYPALKRRFAKLRSATLVAAVDEGARSPRYRATGLLRRAVRPLSMAISWERRHRGEDSIDQADMEAALQLALPLIELPPEASGNCVLAAPTTNGNGSASELVALGLTIANGQIAATEPAGATDPDTWALGSADAWLDAIAEGRGDELRVGGPDATLVSVVVERLHMAII
ncbi:MAG TPA: hypothetical protein VFG58_07510 [Solirubrobacterales bacterium]|nr:hypothetical protein [Solirubrobacterales bacterium]